MVGEFKNIGEALKKVYSPNALDQANKISAWTDKIRASKAVTIGYGCLFEETERKHEEE